MVIDERECATKFCPFGRGAVQVAQDAKGQMTAFVGGVNFTPPAPITHCWGSRCMLWETVSSIESDECHICRGKPEPSKFCDVCKGTGKTAKPYTVSRGYCGAGKNHQEPAK